MLSSYFLLYSSFFHFPFLYFFFPSSFPLLPFPIFLLPFLPSLPFLSFPSLLLPFPSFPFLLLQSEDIVQVMAAAAAAAAAIILETPSSVDSNRIFKNLPLPLPLPLPSQSLPHFQSQSQSQIHRNYFVSDNSTGEHSPEERSLFNSSESSPMQQHHSQYSQQQQQQQQQYQHSQNTRASYVTSSSYSRHDEALRGNTGCITSASTSCSSFSSGGTTAFNKNRHSGYFTFIITNSTEKKIDVDEVKKSFLRSQTFGLQDELDYDVSSKMQQSKRQIVLLLYYLSLHIYFLQLLFSLCTEILSFFFVKLYCYILSYLLSLSFLFSTFFLSWEEFFIMICCTLPGTVSQFFCS